MSSASEESDRSDVEMSASLPLKNQNVPIKLQPVQKSSNVKVLNNQEPKKLSTKEMLYNALSESKSRKGISLYAIKKYMQDTYKVDVEKINHLIKKAIRESVESGTIIQTKGIGASGSFRLAPGVKQGENTTKKPKKPKEKTENGEDAKKPKKTSAKKTSKDAESKKKVADTVEMTERKPKKEKLEKSVGITETKAAKDKDVKKSSKTVIEKSKSTKEKLPAIKEYVHDSPEPGTSKMKTPKKKKNMMKRKSIGSIIKPPKMKPSAK